MKEYLKTVDKINQTFEEFKALVLGEVHEVRQLEQYHLTPQQELIMAYVIRQEQRITANQIASYLNISKSAVSQVISKLEKEGMVVRQTNQGNRRERWICLGSKGQKYARLLEELDEQLVRKYYSKVDLEDLQHVLRTMTGLVTAIKGEQRDNTF
ncbi:MarR family transcriptional regulator [Kroppenstedtia pulmonis]|uniref:MarR family transcriptional regulator n=1 Tax=Kroppenstedtia pulmonis TaxID=1380685 RepID=A0A7D4CGI2_9BACL|nr:MarR family transcriptional regulator [Kroppenstedtia pulmonis]QKG85014.1 MarR family transcriptional regulator [Kroppenstedtia pulmonis]